MSNKLFYSICILFLASLTVPATVIIKNIKFKQECGGYIKQAADANTVELSLSRLEKAIAYAEEKGLTHGYTSVLWKTEDENVGFWYENLVACRDELRLISEKEDASQLEKSNILMKVRESLMDNNGEYGDDITVPDGISRFPNNKQWGTLRCLWWLMVLVFIGTLAARSEDWGIY